ncbi:MAG: hypothetical protein HRT88_20785 [Lentisphaeraceae bacterium]|nr:hypothetical protein [Lentisphaeraceae bacterium]
MNNISAFVKEQKWIVIMLVESKNGPGGPAFGNFLAAHDDALLRLRIQEGMKYVTGFSGGARMSSVNVGVRPGFAGIILQGAGFYYVGSTYIYKSVNDNKNISVCVIMGDKDSNKSEIAGLKKNLPKKNPVRFINFDGGHKWAPAEEMTEALDWMQEQLFVTSQNKEVSRKLFFTGLKSLNKIDSKFLKYQKLILLYKLSSRFKNDPEVKAKLSEIKRLYYTLKKDKQVASELYAQKSYDRVLAKESKVREKLAGGKLKEKQKIRELDQLIRAYKNLANKYKNTNFGKKSADKVIELQAEK